MVFFTYTKLLFPSYGVAFRKFSLMWVNLNNDEKGKTRALGDRSSNKSIQEILQEIQGYK